MSYEEAYRTKADISSQEIIDLMRNDPSLTVTTSAANVGEYRDVVHRKLAEYEEVLVLDLAHELSRGTRLCGRPSPRLPPWRRRRATSSPARTSAAIRRGSSFKSSRST